MAGLELFNENLAVTTVVSGGTDAPAPGTSEMWTVSSSAMFGAAVTGVSQFHVADTSSNYSSEMIAVTNVSGTTWTVTRGAESTTPVAHAGGFSVYQVVTTGWLGSVMTLTGTGTGAMVPGSAVTFPLVMTPVKWVLYNQVTGPQRISAYTYNNGTAGVGATITANGNGALSFYYEPGNNSLAAVGDRLIFQDQYTDADVDAPYPDGIYVITSLGSVSTPWVLTRSADMNTAATIGRYWTVQIQDGAIWGEGWASVTQLIGVAADSPWTLAEGGLFINLSSQQGAAIAPGGVSPGYNAVVLGQNATASGEEAAAVGTTSTASGKIATSYAPYSYATGEYSTTLGYKTYASAEYGVALGTESLAYTTGQVAESSGYVNVLGDSQTSRTTLVYETTTATPANMINGTGGTFTFLTSGGSANYSRCALITITVVGYRTDTKGTASSWVTAPATLVGNGSSYAWATGSAPLFTLVDQSSGASTWGTPTVAVSANALTVTVTGAAGETIDWTGYVQMVETA